jgi:hypothetical protein
MRPSLSTRWGRSGGAAPAPAARSRPSVEALEDRLVPAVTNAQFVNNVFLTVFHRPAEAAAQQGFGAALDQGTLTRQQFLQQIEKTPEYQANVVQALYQQILKRPAEAGAVTYWSNFLAKGGSIVQLEAELFASPEFFQVQGKGTNQGYLQALYQAALGRPIDSSGAQFWGAQLTAGFSTLRVAAELLSTSEAARAEVGQFYQQILGRPADAGGLQFWSAPLQQGNQEQLESAARGGSIDTGAGPGDGLSKEQLAVDLALSSEFSNTALTAPR